MRWAVISLVIVSVYWGMQVEANTQKTGCKCSAVKKEEHKEWEARNSRRRRQKRETDKAVEKEEKDENSTDAPEDSSAEGENDGVSELSGGQQDEAGAGASKGNSTTDDAEPTQKLKGKHGKKSGNHKAGKKGEKGGAETTTVGGDKSGAVTDGAETTTEASEGAADGNEKEGEGAGGEGEVAEGADGEGMAADGEGEAADGEGMAPDGEGEAADGEGMAPDGEGEAAEGGGEAAAGEGEAAEGEGDAAEGAEGEGADDRIVGGYDTTNNKPWVAKLWLKKSQQLCGSTILNKRYLLTAGHCACNGDLKCGKDGKALYKPADELVAYLGLNNMEVDILNDAIKGNKRYEYGTEKVATHPKYMETEVIYDLSLVKLDRDIVFAPGVLEPICLPAADDKSDTVTEGTKLEVYVAGWGRLFASCTTNELGPVKNLKCAFPFKYGGTDNFSCSKTRNPDVKIPECRAFKKANKQAYPKAEGESVVIMDGGKNTTCNFEKAGKNGWCKGIEEDDKFDDNWGWCQDHCNLKEGTDDFLKKQLSSKLQETHLEVLPMAHCKNLVTSRNYEYMGAIEMCAGRKKKFKKITVFQKEGEKYNKKSVENNLMGLDKKGKYSYDYYISGTDSCNGDSGGPLYTWKNGAPVLVGVVSRGYGSGDKDGCAELNFPGIYTRTAKFLDWIYENIKDGNC